MVSTTPEEIADFTNHQKWQAYHKIEQESEAHHQVHKWDFDQQRFGRSGSQDGILGTHAATLSNLQAGYKRHPADVMGHVAAGQGL